MPKGDKLTDKQEKFCHEYLVDLNGTQAVIRSGYSENGSRVTAHRLLTNDNIKYRITEIRDEIQREGVESGKIMTAEQVLEAFTKVARRVDTQDPKMGDVLKALESLAKHKGLFEQDNRQKAPQIIITTDDIQKPDNSGTSGAE